MKETVSPFHATLQSVFGDIPDPRTSGKTQHDMLGIIGLTIAGLLAGANTWVDIEMYGKSCESWLKDLLPLENGIPSHDTLGRFWGHVDGASLEKSFMEWVQSLSQLSQGLQISIDGKVVRRSHDKFGKKKALHVVSAWVNELQITVAQAIVSDKSNEIEGIEKVLDLLTLKDKVVTLDAMGAQKSIANQIREKDGHYILALKENHPALYEEVRSTFKHLKDSELSYVQKCEQWDKGHGRIEHRQCWILDLTHPDFDWIAHEDLAEWPDLHTLIMVEATRQVDGQEQTSCRYYLSSIEAERGAEAFQQYIRQHWGIENSVHWVLDVHFDEDQSRVRTGHAAQNLALLRKLVINILRSDTSSKASLKGRRKKAGWDPNYLLELLHLFASRLTQSH